MIGEWWNIQDDKIASHRKQWGLPDEWVFSPDLSRQSDMDEAAAHPGSDKPWANTSPGSRASLSPSLPGGDRLPSWSLGPGSTPPSGFLPKEMRPPRPAAWRVLCRADTAAHRGPGHESFSVKAFSSQIPQLWSPALTEGLGSINYGNAFKLRLEVHLVIHFLSIPELQ